MKRLLSFAFAMLAISSLCFADKSVCVSSHNGGKHGYKDVVENHVYYDYDETHSLNCTDPGESPCKWSHDPGPATISCDDALDVIVGQINSNHLSGEIRLDGGTLTWEGTDSENYTYTITED